MAAKSILCLLAFVLLVVTIMGSSVEGVAPTQAPVPAAYAPKSPLPYGFGTVCTAMCDVRCKIKKTTTLSAYRYCQRTCTACCALNRCVPNFYDKCGCKWDTVVMYGKIRTCP